MHDKDDWNITNDFLQMDGMYKNIQTSAYTISLTFAGIVITQVSTNIYRKSA